MYLPRQLTSGVSQLTQSFPVYQLRSRGHMQLKTSNNSGLHKAERYVSHVFMIPRCAVPFQFPCALSCRTFQMNPSRKQGEEEDGAKGHTFALVMGSPELPHHTSSSIPGVGHLTARGLYSGHPN